MKRTEEWNNLKSNMNQVKYEGTSEAYQRWLKYEKKRKVRTWIVCAVFVLAALFFLIPFPVSYTYQAMEFKVDDPNYREECTLIIKGTYHVNLFGGSEYKGKLVVSNHPAIAIMEEYDTEIVFDPKTDGSYEYKIRVQMENGDYDRLWCPVGYIQQAGFMRNPCIAISLNENEEKVSDWTDGSGWRTDNGYFVVTGTDDYEKAIDILAEYDFIDQ